MTRATRLTLIACAAAAAIGLGGGAQAQNAMTFFITSAGPGKGADLGGLEGADRHCQTLAQAAGAGGKTWRAYLSTQGANAVNAKDRIGRGPWQNAKGTVVAKDVADLHGANNLNKQTRAEREGRADQRARRHAEPARHPHRLAARRHRVCRRRRPHLRQLDQERRGRRDGRPSRPHGAERGAAGEIVEFLASLARAGWRLQPERPEEHRRRWPVLLLRDATELLHETDAADAPRIAGAAAFSVTMAHAAEPVRHIGIHVQPYYEAARERAARRASRSAARSTALASNRARGHPGGARRDRAPTRRLVTPMTLMVLAIRLYDVGLRDDCGVLVLRRQGSLPDA